MGRAPRICGGWCSIWSTAKLEQEYGSPATTSVGLVTGRKPRNSTARMCCFPKGSIRSPTHLARGLDIRLSAEVTRIAPGFVQLVNGSRIAADRVICTLPLGVLRSGRGQVFFRIPCAGSSDGDRRASHGSIEQIAGCGLTACIGPMMSTGSAGLARARVIGANGLSLARALGAPVLLALNAADPATEIEGLSDVETISAAHEALRSIVRLALSRPRGPRS